jgi:NhaP-type Na+/H+ or K+/H+ antiporter
MASEVIFVFLFLSLTIGALTTYVLSRITIDIPYTVVLFSIGIALSTIAQSPGAIFGTFSLAVLVKYTLPYGWSWDTCFVLGAILCATDPVG